MIIKIETNKVFKIYDTPHYVVWVHYIDNKTGYFWSECKKCSYVSSACDYLRTAERTVQYHFDNYHLYKSL